jgi:hypothetical protein
MDLPPASSPDAPAMTQVRALMATWGVSAVLPLPALVAIDPAISADIACLYLGLACAWMATEFHRTFGVPGSPAAWRARMLALSTVVGVNVALFVGFGLAAGVTTHFPFPLMASLSALPALGMLPWLLRRMPSRPFVAVLTAGILVGSCKLAGCVVARVVYGPDYIEQGYVSADWRTAKLMITLLWTFSTLLSLGMLLADRLCCHLGDVPAEPDLTSAPSASPPPL